MDVPLLVVVTGPPAAGRTTVARRLAASLRLPLLAKDTVEKTLEESVAAGAGLVLEGNFVQGGEIEERLARVPARFVQVHCSAPLELRHDPLDLPGETIWLDTSEQVDVEGLLPRVRRSALWQAVGDAVGPVGEATPLAEKVRTAAWRIVDADIAGLSADELYEVVLPVAFAAADDARRRAHEAIDAR